MHLTASLGASFLTLLLVSVQDLGEWQETSLCYSQSCFHRPTLAQASRQTVCPCGKGSKSKDVYLIRGFIFYVAPVCLVIFFQPSIFSSLFDRHACLGIVHLLYPYLLIFIHWIGQYMLTGLSYSILQWANDQMVLTPLEASNDPRSNTMTIFQDCFQEVKSVQELR